MMTEKMDEMFKPVVDKFVADQNGFYRCYICDKSLSALLMWGLSRSANLYRPQTSFAEAILAGDPNAAYCAAVDIFESVLEHGAGAGGNGHHRAQAFSECVASALMEKRI